MEKFIYCLLITIWLAACSAPPTKNAPPIYPNPQAENPLSIATKTSDVPDGSLFQDGVGPYANAKKYKKGDMLTVIVRESNNIRHDGEVDLSKDSETVLTLDPGGATALGAIGDLASGFSQVQGSRQSTHLGEASYQKSSLITDRVAVVVSEVRADGLIVVWGKRNINFDGETRTLTVNGLINPRDISDTNIVPSDRIAMSTIDFSGTGTLTSTTEPGWAAKGFQWLLDWVWPF